MNRGAIKQKRATDGCAFLSTPTCKQRCDYGFAGGLPNVPWTFERIRALSRPARRPEFAGIWRPVIYATARSPIPSYRR